MADPQVAHAPTRLVGRPLRRGRLSWAGPVYVLGLAVFQLWRGATALGIVMVLLAGSLLVLQMRPPTVIDAAGIRRPWRWRSRFIPWAQVDAIVSRPAATAPGSAPRVSLVAGGRPVVLDDIPADQAALVARIGDRPLRRPPTPVIPVPPPRAKQRSDVDVEADVARRAAALDRGWSDLAAANRHRPPGARRPLS